MQTQKRRFGDDVKRILRVGLSAFLLIALTLAYSYVWLNYYGPGIWLDPFFRVGNYVIVAIYFFLGLLFFYLLGGLKIGYLTRANILVSQMVATFCLNVITFLQIILLYRRLPNPVPMLLLMVVQLAIIVVLDVLFNFIMVRLFPPRKLLVIYGSNPQNLYFKFKARKDKYIIKQNISVDEDWEKIIALIEKYQHDGIVVYDVHSETRNQIVKYCYARNIRVYVSLKISDVLLHNAEILHIFDVPLMLLRSGGLSTRQRFVKRAMDLVVSACLLVITSPFLLGTAIAIKLYDGGPVLFKQNRLTIHGKVFKIYKFRSMIVDAEKDGVARLSTVNDDRITPVGKFIRATRLDELPQLFNIFKGDMSLVGPRPERPEIAAEYEKDMPEFAYRLKVKAGLTGYAQIYGKYNTTAYDKLKLDLMYIEDYSIFTDLKLMLITLKIIFMKESTEGLDDSETIAKTTYKKDEE